MEDWKTKNLPARCICMLGVISGEVTFDVKAGNLHFNHAANTIWTLQ